LTGTDFRRHIRGTEAYNRYEILCDQFKTLVFEELSATEDGEPMWKINVETNHPQKTLQPRNAEESKRRARLGSMEVILSWRSAGRISHTQYSLLLECATFCLHMYAGSERARKFMGRKT